MTLTHQRKSLLATWLWTLLLGLLVGADCFGANWYVTPAANGTSGADWNNSFCASNINYSSISGGDTIWFAGGTYSYGDASANPTITISKSGTAGSPITFKRATVNDSAATSAAGWNSNYGTNIFMYGGSANVIQWNRAGYLGSYVTIDGQGSWQIAENTNNQTDGIAIASGGSSDQCGGVSNIFLANLEIIGVHYWTTPNDCANTNASGWVKATTPGIEIYPGYDANRMVVNTVISNCWIHGFYGAVQCNLDPKYKVWGITVDHCTVNNNGSGAADHCNLFYVCTEIPGSLAIRFCNIWDWSSEGIWDYATNRGPVYVYGNIIHDKSSYGDGNPFDDHEGAQVNNNSLVYVVNNTFWNMQYTLYGKTNGFNISPSSIYENNLFAACTYEYKPTNPGTAAATPFGTWDYNYATNNILNPYNNGIDVHSINNSGVNPLVSPGPNGNFNIVTNIGAAYPRNAGIFVSNVTDSLLGTIDFSKDANGTSRAGLWSIGALEVTNSVTILTTNNVFNIGYVNTSSIILK